MLYKGLAGAIAAFVLAPFIRGLWDMDWGLHLHQHRPGKCRQIKQEGIGSEDFQILSSGLTFITSGLVTNEASPCSKDYIKSRSKGIVQILDLNAPNPEAWPLKIKHGKDFDPDTFRPHGLSVLEDKVKGEHLLYVINHAENQSDRVEKFRYSPGKKELIHVKSIFSDKLLLTNDLTVLEEDTFFISNCAYFENMYLSVLEHISRIPLGNVLFYNGSDFSPMRERIFSPNGVILSQDNRFLYISLPFSKIVEVYERQSNQDFRLLQVVNVHTFLDNFHLSEQGDSLYGGCHPILHKLFSHVYLPEIKTPSQVLRLPLKDGLIVEEGITEEFVDHGDLISGSSVAGVYKRRMLIGSVYDRLALCDLPAWS